jgi:hypothetical protein
MARAPTRRPRQLANTNAYTDRVAGRNWFRPSGACVSRREEYGGAWSAFARRLGSVFTATEVPRVAASFDRVSPKRNEYAS